MNKETIAQKKAANIVLETARKTALFLKKNEGATATKILEVARKVAEPIIKETALAVQQSTKSENSGLISDIKKEVVGLRDHLVQQDLSINTLENHYNETKDILARIEGSTNDSLNRIEAQTTKTNGRVGLLEIWKANRNGWVAGGGALIFVVMGLLTYIFNNALVNINNNISRVENSIK